MQQNLLHHRARRQDRQGAVAHLDGRAPGRTGRRHLGRCAADVPRRGDAWITGSYDPAMNLIYWSTAQAKPWARAARGTDGDALYTNSTLALDPDTGKIVWHNQQLPGETHDMDEVFENILVDVGRRKSLFKMGKLGMLWELDRKTGKFVSAFDLGYQNLIDVDPQTGKVTYRPGMIPQSDVDRICPSTAGFKSWRAMAYHPETQAFYIPLLLTCEKGTFTESSKVEGGGGLGPGPTHQLLPPGSRRPPRRVRGDGSATGRLLWMQRAARTVQHRGAHHGGRPRVRRRLGSLLLRLRHADGQAALAEPD